MTAQKRGENLQAVPIAITAASGETLVATGITTTVQLNTLAPGLNIRTTAGAFQPSIRGIGTSSNVVENPVSLYIDGVYLPSQREGLRDLNDIEQIAVLKGPQGTLFGRNATGGIIQITTRRPSFEFGGEVGVSIDNYALLKTDVYVTGGLTDKIAASLSAQYGTQGNGWGTNLTTGTDTFKLRSLASVRGKLLFQPDSDTDITLIGDYMSRRTYGNSFQPFPGFNYSFAGAGPLSSVYDTYASIDSKVDFKGGGVSLTASRKLNFAQLVSISSYRKGSASNEWDIAGTRPSRFIVRSPGSPSESYTQELQLISGPGRFSWVVGIFYFHNLIGAEPIERTITGPLAPLPTSTTVNTTFGREITESIAPFGQFDWEFVEATKLTVGARYTLEKRSADIRTTLQRVNGTAIIQSLNDSVSIKEPTFRLALSHEFAANVLGYVSFNTGVKSGGFNILNASNPGYLPEKLTAYEIGLKSQLLDRRLRFNLAGFYYDYSNVQVIQFLSGIQSIVNGAAAKLYGLDVDLEAKLAEGLRVSGGFALLHTEFTDYRNAVFSAPLPNGGARLFVGDATGNRLPLAQAVSGTLGLDYHSELSRGSLDFNTTANYNGKYFFDADNFLAQGDYVLLNTSLKYTLPGKRASVMIWGRNLLDEKVISQAATQNFGYTSTWGNAPRTYGMTVRLQF